MSDQRGFTLLEVLVSLAIFAVVVVGALGVLGATSSGGFLEGFPTGFSTTRSAKDATAASVYLQAFHEYVAAQNTAALVPGVYCDGPDCPSANLASSGLSGWPTPPGQPYQLDWRRLDVTIERWCWDDSVRRYVHTSTCDTAPSTEYLVRVRSVLTWRYRSATRTLTLDRFVAGGLP